MPASKAHIRATTKWEKENYFRTMIRLPKDLEEVIRQKANEDGKSLNGYLADLVKKDIGATD